MIERPFVHILDKQSDCLFCFAFRSNFAYGGIANDEA
jgi:hypothetical protein